MVVNDRGASASAALALASALEPIALLGGGHFGQLLQLGPDARFALLGRGQPGRLHFAARQGQGRGSPGPAS